MAKKKNRHNPPKPAEFRSTPFGALKGVLVGAPTQQPEPSRPTPAPKPPAGDDADLFLQAMEDVRKLDNRPSPSRSAARGVQPPPAADRPGERVLEKERMEREAFAQAIGQLKLDVTFNDHTPEDEEIKPLGANRVRQLKRGIVSVERQLDLHGLTREEALEALPRFLASASAHGEKAVLVITGKGNNSPGEPVLQQAVLAWLRDAGRKLVQEFAPAPREMGGSGAFVLFLRS